MLALTRKIDQQIQIGSDICITILHVRGKQVRIGIEAPRQVKVVRGELSNEVGGGLTISLSDLLAPTVANNAGAKPAVATRPAVRRRSGSPNPGERAFSSGRQPLAAKLHARRAPHAAPVAIA
jgi:carbon storage regulator CsrA